jgi:hypothetical protein
MPNDEGMTNLMNPTHSLSLALLLKPIVVQTPSAARRLRICRFNDLTI